MKIYQSYKIIIKTKIINKINGTNKTSPLNVILYPPLKGVGGTGPFPLKG